MYAVWPSFPSPFARAAARSFNEMNSELTLDTSLPPLLLRSLPPECRCERADVDVALVVVESVIESRELVVGVPVVALAEDAEPRLRA